MVAKKRENTDMAAKRTGRRRQLTGAQAKKLAREARADVQRLLKGTQAGTVTRQQLETGLEEIAADLTDVMGFHYFRIS